MVFDYLNDDDDLLIADGDFVRGESTLQHQDKLLRLKKGEIRRYPKTGVGIEDFLQDDEPGDIYAEIQKQFEADKLVIRNISVILTETTGILNAEIEAYYP